MPVGGGRDEKEATAAAMPVLAGFVAATVQPETYAFLGRVVWALQVAVKGKPVEPVVHVVTMTVMLVVLAHPAVHVLVAQSAVPLVRIPRVELVAFAVALHRAVMSGSTAHPVMDAGLQTVGVVRNGSCVDVAMSRRG